MTTEERPNGLVQWGDEEFDDDTSDHQKPGMRVETEIRTNQQGQRIKVTRTIKTVKVTNRVNRIIEERKKRWVKFGAAVKWMKPLEEENTEFVWEKVNRKAQKNLEEQIKREMNKCVTQSTKSLTWSNLRRAKENAMSQEGPVMRAFGGAKLNASHIPLCRRQDDPISIRVSNLSEDVTDVELKELFSQYGTVNRVYLATDKTGDKDTKTNKGFAFISYANREHAEEAIRGLQGYGLHHLILQLEWSRGSNRP